MKSFLQTKEWMEFQESLGRPVEIVDSGNIRAFVVKHYISFGKNYLYIPYGPYFDLENVRSGLRDEVNTFLQKLRELAKKQKSIFVKIEPQSDIVMELIYRRGLKRSKKQIQPQKTVIIDLKKKAEDLSAELHHKTRYNYKLAHKKDLNFYQSDDIDIFWKLLKKTSKEDNFHTHKKEYYEKLLNFFKEGKDVKTRLVLVSHEEKPIAGAVLLIYDNTVYYLHGAMDRNYKNLMAPYLMHWEIIMWAKSRGYEYYDLWGIDAKKWPGVTRFKLGWGGKVVEYPGSFDLSISGFWYFIYRLARKIF